MTRAIYAVATVLYATARAVEWAARHVHREAHRRSIATLPTAKETRPRSVP